MNKHLTNIKSAVLGHHTELKQRGIASSELKKQLDDGNISKNAYEEQVEALKADYQDKTGAFQAIDGIKEAYQKELDEWAVLSASNLTDDLKIFNSPIELDAADYESLEKKYQCNYSMLKAIKDHAKKNDAIYNQLYSVDKAEKIQAFDNVVVAAKNIIESVQSDTAFNYNVALWGKDEAFDNIYSDVSKAIQTNEGSNKIISSDGSVSWG